MIDKRDADRWLAILEREAHSHGPTDYKHHVAALLRSLLDQSNPDSSTPKCWCTTCRPITVDDMRFVVCPECGNKRCPKANNHNLQCTGSNDVGQLGSSWEHVGRPVDPINAGDETEAELALRSLASWLGAGGFNAPKVDAKVFEKKIRDGVDALLRTPYAFKDIGGHADSGCLDISRLTARKRKDDLLLEAMSILEGCSGNTTKIGVRRVRLIRGIMDEFNLRAKSLDRGGAL